MFSCFLRNVCIDLLLSARLLSFHYAVYCGLCHRGDLKHHRPTHWYANGSGSWVDYPFLLFSIS
jgi:hypothetical protein